MPNASRPIPSIAQAALAPLLAGALLAGSAMAQAQAPGPAPSPVPGAWQEYRYPDQGVVFQLPVPPSVQDGTGPTPTGITAPVTTYRAQGDRIVYTLQIFDLSKAGVNGDTIIADTEKALAGSGKVDVAVNARINRQFGRELTIETADGGRLTAALFYVNQRLYELVAKALPPDPADRSAQAIHFQQSLQFTGEDGQGFGGGFAGRGGRFGGGPGGGQAAQAACAGKAAGDKVTLQTPDGNSQAATCVLVARPDRPPGGGRGGPGGPPPPQ